MTGIFIYAVGFIVGAIVMGFEMLGARYLNPYLGSGIYTWASLISTVLTALAAGYFAGGWAADRYPSLKMLGFVVISGALYLVALPLFADDLLLFIAERVDDVRLGSLLAALLLMVWPVALLGMYSPFAIRLMLDSPASSGSVSGNVYGISTVGSIIGTLGTSFYLIPQFGTRFITVALGCLGVAAGLALVLVDRQNTMNLRRTARVLVGLLALLCANWLPARALAETPLDAAIVAQVLKRGDGQLKRIESEYNDIYITKRGPLIGMSFRRYGTDYTESVSDLTDPKKLPIEYTRFMTLGLSFPEKVGSVLMIGVGGGSLAVYLKSILPQLSIDMVDLDPAVLSAAKTHFGLREAADFKLIESDGRVYLARNPKVYDVLLIDAFRGGYVPFHLLTQEFYELLKRRLAPKGVAVFNIHSGTKLYDSTIKTLQHVFPMVELFETDAGSVIAVVAAATIDMADVAARAKAAQANYRFTYPLPGLMAGRFSEKVNPATKLLTDDFSPAAVYDVIKKNNVRQW